MLGGGTSAYYPLPDANARKRASAWAAGLQPYLRLPPGAGRKSAWRRALLHWLGALSDGGTNAQCPRIANEAGGAKPDHHEENYVLFRYSTLTRFRKVSWFRATSQTFRQGPDLPPPQSRFGRDTGTTNFHNSGSPPFQERLFFRPTRFLNSQFSFSSSRPFFFFLGGGGGGGGGRKKAASPLLNAPGGPFLQAFPGDRQDVKPFRKTGLGLWCEIRIHPQVLEN